MLVNQASTLATYAVLFGSFSTAPAYAYRIGGSGDENKPFVPYEKGFVGHTQDPATSQWSRTNQGYESSVLLGDSVGKNRLFSCPMMVGPLSDQKYYCRGKEYGYCDRRSGACFCNDGYTGNSCESCAPTHFELGGLCYPKRLCPNDCSHAGECDYLLGKCLCHDHRLGDDCSQSKCTRFHPFCTHCNDEGCMECEEGFNADASLSEGSQCQPCHRYDPRCIHCNSDECTLCIDLLLLSIHRSGGRPHDPPLPADELMRELSITVPFGSTQEDAFYDAEHYFLVDHPMIPLNESAVECHQGLNGDDSISCVPYNMSSHIMCGNHGTITFDSPEYAILENAKHVRLTLQRTGGGVGEVSVSYSIYPITAGNEDVTATAYYTSNQTIVFQHGQIRASFLVSINDDRVMEQNETFSVHLSNPTGFAELGTQQRTIVTIIDDDEHKTCSNQTSLRHEGLDLGYAIAGSTPLKFKAFTKSCAGDDQITGGDMFKVHATKIDSEKSIQAFNNPAIISEVLDMNDGSYEFTINSNVTGTFDLVVFQLVQGGLKGHYFADEYLNDTRLHTVRIDSVVNFTWGAGPLTTFGNDFISVRWEGFVQPKFSETYTFWLDMDDHARLWIDGILIIDWWGFPPSSGLLNAEYDLVAFEAHYIVLEYRDISFSGTARLLWSSENTPIQAIPSSSLFYKEPIGISTGPKRFSVHPTTTSALKSRAFGEGLHYGVAGFEHSFVIRPNDSFGNFRGWPSEPVIGDSRHLDRFSANATMDASLVVPVKIEYNKKTRIFVGSYVPTISGLYQLNVVLEGQHIFGSPFMVNTQPSNTFAPNSVAYGGSGFCLPLITTPCIGLEYGMAGRNSSFFIESYDKHGNRKEIGGDNWIVTVASSIDRYDYHSGNIVDLGNGTYSVLVAPQISGPNLLSITLNGVHIRHSPFRMQVMHNRVSGPSSFIVDGNENVLVAMIENTLILQARDAWGNNAIYCNEQPFDTIVTVESENILSGNTSVEYRGSGKYALIVTPLKTEATTLTIKLNGEGIHFNTSVIAGEFDSSETSASGPGLRQAIAGEVSTFIIQSKDAGGNNKKNHVDMHFNVTLVLVERQNLPVQTDDLIEAEPVSGAQRYIGDGQFEVTYSAEIAGLYLLYVRSIDGKGISGSPFSVTVMPAVMSAEHSVIVGQGIKEGIAGMLAEVRLYARDEHRNFVDTYNIDQVESTLTLRSRHHSQHELANGFADPINTTVIKYIRRDLGGGIFNLDYTPMYAGEYEMDIAVISPGGLQGSYFSSIDFSQSDNVLTKLENEIIVNWNKEPFSCEEVECTPIRHLTGSRNFGISWSGYLSSNHNEDYTIGIFCNDGGLASLAIDGRFVKWQSCWPRLTTSLAMKTHKTVHFSLRYKNLDGEAFMNLKWSSPSETSNDAMVTIPRRNLHRKILAKSLNPMIYPNKAFPPASVAVGESLRTAIAGLKHQFIVEARDEYGDQGAFGNLLLGGGASISAHGLNQQDEIEVFVIDNLNGTYTGSYTPEKSGTYLLSVLLTGSLVHHDSGNFAFGKRLALSHIKGSPFLLNVAPGAADPRQSELVSSGIFEQVTGRDVIVNLQAYDALKNRRRAGGDTIVAHLTSSPNVTDIKTPVECNSKYMHEGLYSLMCPAVSIAGKYHLDVKFADIKGVLTPIRFSPFDVLIHPGHATPETTEISSEGVEVDIGTSKKVVRLKSHVGLFGSFVVTAKDIFANEVNVGGNHFVARVRGDTNAEPSDRLVRVIDQGNGDYVFAYKVTYSSSYNVDVAMVTKSGIRLEYFVSERSFKEGTPDKTFFQSQLGFESERWTLIRHYTHFRWTGYISFPHGGDFQLHLDGVDGYGTVWIDEVSGVFHPDDKQRGLNFNADENILYDLKIEYVSVRADRFSLKLFWSSKKIREQLVSKKYLFNTPKPIKGSPFALVVS